MPLIHLISKMLKRYIILFLCLVPIVLSAQDNYSISLSPVSTTKFDEYSPVLYRGKLVYISNNKLDMLLNAKTAENKNP